MDNEHIKSDITDYLTGKLPEARRREVDAHIATCEACRSAVDKARSKQARKNRQALKSAVPDRVPNLLLNRLGKQAGIPRPVSNHGWLWFGAFFLLVGLAYLAIHFQNRIPFLRSTPTTTAETSSSVGTDSSEDNGASVAASTAVPVDQPASVATKPEPSTGTVEAAAPYTPQQWGGQDSQIKEYREVVIRGRSAWRTLWSEMGQGEPAPRVNFNSAIVIGIFAGEKPLTGYQVTFGAANDTEEKVVVPFRMTPPVHGLPGVTHPYTLMTIPRVPKRVVFIEQPS